MASAKWAAAYSGSWYAAANWSTGAVPGGPASSDDVATIDTPGSYTIDVGSTGTTIIGGVNLNATGAALSILGAGLTVTTALTVNNGALALVSSNKGTSLLVQRGSVVRDPKLGAVLDGVTLRGPATLIGQGSPAPAVFRNSLTLVGADGSGPGVMTLIGLSLQAADTETLDNAAVRLVNSTLSAASGSRLTLGRGLALDVTGMSTLTNAVSQGSITIEGNGTLNLDGDVASTGAIELKLGGTLNLAGTTTTARLLGLNARAAGPGSIGMAFGATLDNTGATLTLVASSRLQNMAASYLTVNGGTIVNAGGNIAFTGTTVLDGVTWQGAFAPTLAANFIFRHGTVVRGKDGGRASIALGASGSKLGLSATLDNTDLRLSNGSLSTLLPGPVMLGAGVHLTLSGSFATFPSGERFEQPGLNNAGTITQTGVSSYAALTNSGTIAISNGTGAASTLVNNGLISLDAATLTIGAASVLGGTVAFMDPTARLVFQGMGVAGANLQDFQNGNSVDLQGLAYNASLSVRIQGDTVQVNAGNALVGTFHLSGGSYSADQFSLAADGAGGTLLRTTHPLNAPATGGPGKDFDAVYYLAHNGDVAAAGFDPLRHYLDLGWKEGRNPNAYFNTNWYLNQNPDVRTAGVNPLQHYEEFGWREGRDPGSSFSISAYLTANPDVRTAGVDPLQHFLTNGRAEGRLASPATPHAVGAQDGLVDRGWYLAQHPDVAVSGEDASANYHRVGWTLGYNPDQWFDTTYYLKTNADVAAAHVDPLAHFEAFGSREGREPSLVFNGKSYLAHNADVAAAQVNPLAHYMSYGRLEGRIAFITGPQTAGAPDPLVDRTFYYAQFATIVPGSADAASSYDQTGWRLGLNPDAYFDTAYYLSHNADVRLGGVNPLKHYETHGWKEGRDPSATFSTNKYLAAYSDVRSGAMDPLTSFVTTGLAQGRSAFAI